MIALDFQVGTVDTEPRLRPNLKSIVLGKLKRRKPGVANFISLGNKARPVESSVRIGAMGEEIG